MGREEVRQTDRDRGGRDRRGGGVAGQGEPAGPDTLPHTHLTKGDT